MAGKRPPYEKLAAWTNAMNFADSVYDLTLDFPRREWDVSARQVRRAALSVSSNIVEGYMRESDAEFRRFLVIARASLHEARSQLSFCRRRDYISAEEHRAIETLANQTSFLIQRTISNLAKTRA